MESLSDLLQSADQAPNQPGPDTFNSSLSDERSASSQASDSLLQYPAHPQIDEHHQPTYGHPEPGGSFRARNSSRSPPVAAPFVGARPQLLGEIQGEVNLQPSGDGTYSGAYTTQDNRRTFHWNHGIFFPYPNPQPGTPHQSSLTTSSPQIPQFDQHGAELHPFHHEAYGQVHHHDVDATSAQLLGDTAVAAQENNPLDSLCSAAPHPANPAALTIPAYHQGLANHHVNSALALGLLGPPRPLTPQPHQDQFANHPGEEEAAHAIPGLANDNNPLPPPHHPPANGAGKRAQRSARLHAQGLCIWCRQPNPDLTKMGCPACLPKRAAKTAQYRVRKKTRERARAGQEIQGDGLVSAQGGSVDGDGEMKEGGEVEEKGEQESEEENDDDANEEN